MNQSAPPHTTPHPAACSGSFTQLLSATRRGARLARLLGVGQLRSWEMPQDLVERAEVVVAELAANAVLHAHVPGRCFRLTLVHEPAAGLLRVEVSDARGDLHPRLPAGPADADALRSGGRGLALVAALADHWDCVPFPPVGKTVRAVLSTRGDAIAISPRASGAVRMSDS
ncbi:ATP-binding protein [Streptomyces thermospinosisporus]|uniref:ATP-binding protein n=1 Tax=Streptomyces thermospinosisporus TaxID=161482 RepID=A0ABP4JM75_9ACTN